MIRISAVFILIIQLFWGTGDFPLNNRIKAMIQKEVSSSLELGDYVAEGIHLPDSINNLLDRPLYEDNFFEVTSKNATQGYYYLGKAFGKVSYFDFLVVVDKELTIKRIKILRYREDHGGEVASKRWLRQFTGLTPGSALKFGEDISGISGATLSAKALTHEVNLFSRSLGEFSNLRRSHEN
jgi:hypothetical protein